jgi:hypothetical protein
MNRKKWVNGKLISNLPPNSVNGLDNASYYDVLKEKSLSCSLKKKLQNDWHKDNSFPIGNVKTNAVRLHKIAHDNNNNSIQLFIINVPCQQLNANYRHSTVYILVINIVK